MRPALLLLSLAGCAPLAMVLDPPLGQLARWHDTPALAAEQPVITPCPDANPACPQLHARRAEACMATAMAARAPRSTPSPPLNTQRKPSAPPMAGWIMASLAAFLAWRCRLGR